MNKKILSVTVFTLLLLNGLCSISIAADEASGPFDLTGKIMVLDLVNDSTIIAEKQFYLLSETKSKKDKIWITHFLDKNGNEITPDKIAARDRVRITGKEAYGKLIVYKMTILE